MDNTQQALITFLVLGAVQVWSIVRDWLHYQQNKEVQEQTERKALREALQEDYERVKAERDELLLKKPDSAERDILIESLRTQLKDAQNEAALWKTYVDKILEQRALS